ncbi:MAG: galactose mutarotase [Fimbriimonadaceae bacterium]|nr:galactose mutarotase [Fimbriimonadaceae bacterium]
MAVHVSNSTFGELPDGRAVTKYHIENSAGTRVAVMDYGAAIIEISTLDNKGALADIILGFDTLEPYYATRHPYFGSTVGRVAGRIANATFELGGKQHKVTANTPPHHLHGGEEGFDRKLWRSDRLEDGVAFTLVSPDGDQGYPGTVSVYASYRLVEDNTLRLDYEATTDAPTLLNLTNHTYFNLKGTGNGTVLNHELLVESETYAGVTPEILPTGQLLPVEGTPLDFRTPTTIGERIARIGGTPAGFDHAFALDRQSTGIPKLACVVHEPTTGRVLEAWTTDICLQFYTGNFLDGTIIGKAGKSYSQHAGLCLECQHFPGSPNRPEFPPVTLLPDQTYRQTTLYKFGTR